MKKIHLYILSIVMISFIFLIIFMFSSFTRSRTFYSECNIDSLQSLLFDRKHPEKKINSLVQRVKKVELISVEQITNTKICKATIELDPNVFSKNYEIYYKIKPNNTYEFDTEHSTSASKTLWVVIPYLEGTSRIKELLNKGADLNYIPEDEKTKPSILIRANDIEKIKYLFEYGVRNAYYKFDIYEKDALLVKETYLLMNWIGNKEITKYLLSQNILQFDKVKKPIEDGYLETSPIHLALINADFDIAKLLIKAGVNLDTVYVQKHADMTFYNTLLTMFVSARNHKVVEFLLKNGANPNKKITTPKDMITMYPLVAAVLKDDVKMVKILLDYGAKANTTVTFNSLDNISNSQDLIDIARDKPKIYHSNVYKQLVKSSYMSKLEELCKSMSNNFNLDCVCFAKAYSKKVPYLALEQYNTEYILNNNFVFDILKKCTLN